MLGDAAVAAGLDAGDVLVVAHKVVSKAEDQIIRLEEVTAGPRAIRLAEQTGKEPKLCEVILAQSRRIVAQRGGTLICETHRGLVCANAAIDRSNTDPGTVIVLPEDPDRSARHIQQALISRVKGHVGVVITDTHGRAFRRGLINIAVGVAGFDAVVSHRGGHDRNGRLLRATDQAIADELAAVGGMLMVKGGNRPAIVVSGAQLSVSPGGAGELVRDPEHDLFRSAP